IAVALPMSAAVFVLAMLPHLLHWTGPLGRLLGWIHTRVFDRINAAATFALNAFVHGIYLPMLRWSLRNAPITLAAATAILLWSIGLCMTDRIKFVYMPKMDGNTIMASITYPDGTPASVTEAATRRIEEAIYKVARKHESPEQPLVELVHRTVGQPSTLGRVGPTGTAEGSHLGTVGVEIVAAEKRDIRSIEIVNEWRAAAGNFPGAENVEFATAGGGPGGSPIEFRLLARPRDMNQLERAIEECKEELKRHPGVFDIKDDSQPGKWEFQVTVKEDAKSLGLSAADLAETVRAAYYGEEVMRLQRGRHEVKLMVRYPREQRRSLADFENIRVRMQPSMSSILGRASAVATRSSAATVDSTPLVGAAERPLTELADIRVERGYSAINRLDQLRSITVTADVNEDVGNAQEIVNAMKADFFPGLMHKYPGLRLNWEGQQEQTRESIAGLKIGMALALVAMFALLTLEFRSYAQPIMILLIIPFGAIGAVIGHLIMGLDITMFSLFGLVALSGVVINDSIVLIDFMNHRVRAGIPLHEALLDAGRRRFRPVLLTSVTTIAGLLPILFERSFQAQVLIPMATSMAFGLMFTTALMLILVPTMYLVYVRIAVGDESRMVTEPEPGIGQLSTEFAANAELAKIGQLAAVSDPKSPTETVRQPLPADTVLLEPIDTALSASSMSSERNDKGDGEEPSDQAGRVERQTARPRQQSWPPPSHLPRTGGQD
ncbi:MAG: efflux RND transporter permease subunit, partial [Pirellulaceae bacterium]|nr:efflux RND transporter permease subunit [Pirellulaceae bacterium]